MLVRSASVQIPNQGGCESEQNGWGQSFCSEMFSLHSCSGKGVDMWLLKKSWKVMHNWPHTTPNKDSNFPIYLEADDSDGSHTNLCRSYFKTKKVNLAEVEAATECYFSQKLLLVDPDLLLLEKKTRIFPEAILWSCFRCYVFQSHVRTTHDKKTRSSPTRPLW